MRIFSTILLGLLLFVSCSEDQVAPTTSLPFNLQATVTVSSTVEGLVDVSASASLTNYYEVEFFHDDGSKIISTTDGNASYQYSISGTYVVLIRAHSSFNEYIEVQETVTVEISEPVVGIPTTGYTTPLSYPGYSLVWNDEFAGSQLSSTWTHKIGTGNGGWGNNELQYYRPENTEVKDGYLVITAKEELYGGSNYTSSRIVTRSAQSFKYGRIDIRAALPKGKGMWPALWMLGDSYSSVGWPKCGEIDIMEMVGGSGADRGDNFVFGTTHWWDNGQHAEYGGSNKLPTGKYSDEFHVFTIIWSPNSIKWYRDDIKYHEINITGAGLSEFHENFHFIFNVAVGGEWPGSPNGNTQFPQIMAVDYVRVFQQ